MAASSIASTRCSSSSPPPTTPPASSSSDPTRPNVGWMWVPWPQHPPGVRGKRVTGSLGRIMKTVAIVGSTGSIGTQTIDVIKAEPGAYDVVALGASSSVELLAKQAVELQPQVVALADASRASELRDLLPPDIELRTGPD